MHPPRKLLILFGSETGTAADLALEVARLAERHHFNTTCIPASDLAPLSSLPTWNVVVFVTATTGQGEVPGNMRSFWKFLLRKKLPADWLRGTQFTTFGCGDSAYLKFNWAVRKVHKRFLQLGARELGERGEGDEQHAEGIDGAFLPWSEQLIDVLLQKYPLPPGLEPIPRDQLLPPKYLLRLSPSGPVCAPAHLSVPRPGALTGAVTANTRVTPETHFQDVRHITITLPTPVSYAPGDTVSILPQNHPTDVSQLLALQSWDPIADTPLELIPNPALPPDRIPATPPIEHAVSPLTLRTLLTCHLDITAIPRRGFFSVLAQCAGEEQQKERLREFADPALVEELWDYTTRPRRSILEVLQEFHSVRIPLEMLLETIPVLRERQFSIASSASGHQLPPQQQLTGGASSPSSETTIPPTTTTTHTIEILAAIVKYRTIIKKTRLGVCTRYLASLLPPSSPITLTLHAGTLAAPPDLAKPALMIAPGTGVAPMRALIWFRALHAPVPARNLLFFGCRNRGADFYFEAEWQRLEADGKLAVRTAFSRDEQEGGGKGGKRYVQSVIRECAGEVWAMMQGGAVVYVCGSAGRMVSAVREALVEVAEREGGMGRGEAEGWVCALEKEGRWRQETWG